jgi:serine/threonine-protein kinase
MSDHFYLEPGKSIRSENDEWYRCVQTLGTGGNAVTFLVMSTSGANAGTLFALKVFRKLSSKERRDRFLEEISLLKEVNHPSIMKVFDEGLFKVGDSNYPFVVAEYLPFTLQKVLQRDIPFTEKLVFTTQLLSALAYLNERKSPIVHRDIKPANIFIKGHSCVLGDFGLMKVLDGSEEIDREIFKESIGIGMPYYYRTPDLVAYANNKSPISTKSDVFQLGLVVAQLFTGRNPCKPANDPLDLVELEHLHQIPGKLGASVFSLIMRMLSMEPDQRPSASELINQWQANFFDAVIHMQELEGKVF